ncbi:MAG TPA: aminotransferase class V-fold PLP-dependent enzyme [Candidatus Polarisedimenticolia bacterium]|nr:aminotransferase class V-fold PLP-dependent enzyme [Candidatus Polarisedimenticolia bacterium]
MKEHQVDAPRRRDAPVEMSPEEFRRAGHRVVDLIADWLGRMPDGPVTRATTPRAMRAVIGERPLPADGAPALPVLEEAARLLFEHSLFNGHPRFWGYITSSATPLGALADLLASSVNPNVGGWQLSPLASEIEAQTIRWLGELIGFPAGGGLLVSGGNMANMVAFFAARRAKTPWDLRALGLAGRTERLVMYASTESHTWIQKAADLSGLGTNAIRWIDADAEQRMDVGMLERRVREDRAAGLLPFLVVGAAGTVSTGAIDPLPAIADLAAREHLWFHVDGAYGAPAAALEEAPPDLRGLAGADSIALDPHKWLYAPLEAGCTLVREPKRLADAFSFHPTYYHFGDPADEDPQTNYYELGLQNSRGFRALKVWLGLKQAGRAGHIKMIRDDIALARALHRAAAARPDLETVTCNLSIATFRYVPPDLKGRADAEKYLDTLNEEVLNRIKDGGEAFVSNAVVGGRFVLRACIVNFRTTLADVEALPALVARLGRKADDTLRPAALRKR